jgi:hypothetical protein
MPLLRHAAIDALEYADAATLMICRPAAFSAIVYAAATLPPLLPRRQPPCC